MQTLMLITTRFLARSCGIFLILALPSSSASNVPLENQEKQQKQRQYRRSLADYEDDELVPVLAGCVNDVGQLHLSNSAVASGVQPETFLHNRVVSTQVRKDEIPQLQSDPNIRFIEYDGLNFADNDATSYALTTTQSISNSLTAGSNAFALGSCNDRNVIRVAVIDSGLDADHPDIGCGNNGCIGTSWGTNREWNSPDDIHGTHVTGLITALRNGIGLQGVVPDGDLCLLVARVFDGIDDGVRTSTLVQAVEWAIDNGASVINFSISGQDFSFAFREIIDSAYRDKGVILVAAAGNTAAEEVRYPAAYDNVVAVTALDATSERRAWYATYGNYIDYAVAGSQILSTVPRNLNSAASLITISIENGYTTRNGFLMATSVEINENANLVGTLVDCGIGDRTCPTLGSNSICLIQRGAIEFDDIISFFNKAQVCQDSNGVAAIIYNNVEGPIGAAATLNNTNGLIQIPVISIPRAEGLALRAQVNRPTEIEASARGYGFATGTSSSAPIVSGIMLGLRRSCPQCALPTIESCMASTASRVNEDFTGNGIAQMESAFGCLQSDDCCRDSGVQAQQDIGPVCSPDMGACRSNGDCCSQLCATSSNTCLPARDRNFLREEATARQGHSLERSSSGKRGL